MHKILALSTVFCLLLTVTGFQTPKAERLQLKDTKSYTVFENMDVSQVVDAGNGGALSSDVALELFGLKTLLAPTWMYLTEEGEETLLPVDRLVVTGQKMFSKHYYREDPNVFGGVVIFTLTEVKIDNVLEQHMVETSYHAGDIITIVESYAFNHEGKYVRGIEKYFAPMQEENQYILVLTRNRIDNGYFYGVNRSEVPQGVWLANVINLFNEDTITLRTKEALTDFIRRNRENGQEYLGDYTLLPEILNTYFPQEAS